MAIEMVIVSQLGVLDIASIIPLRNSNIAFNIKIHNSANKPKIIGNS